MENLNISAHHSVPLIETRAICKSYRGLLAVASVNFDLIVGEVHGLVGANGAGKSTFTKILTGAIRPDSGSIYLNSNEITLGSPRDGLALGIAGIYQELATVPKMSVLSNVFLGNPICKGFLIDRAAMAKRFQEISEAFGLRMPANTPAGSLSVANRQKVEILKAIQAGRKILIMDEPTAALDPKDRQALYTLIRRLAAAGSSIIFISHDLNEVLMVCSRVSVMRDGAIIDTRPVSQWTTDTLVAAMLGSTTQVEPAVREQRGTNDIVFHARNIRVEGRVDGVSLYVRRGEILGIAGLVGSGRSELLRAIFGAERSATGQIEINGKKRELPRSVRDALTLGIVMVPEDRKLQGLVLGRDGYFNIALSNLSRFSRAGVLRRPQMRQRFDGVAADVKLSPRRLHNEVAKLSGGNQQKVLLAKWIVREPLLLLLDEPSRGVDVAARTEIYSTIAKLAARGVAIVLVSSDMDEIIQNSDRVIVLQAGCSVGVLSRGEADLERVLKLKFSATRRQA